MRSDVSHAGNPAVDERTARRLNFAPATRLVLRGLRAFVIAALACLPPQSPAAAADGDAWQPTGESWRSPFRHVEHRFLRHGVTGEKVLVRPDGRTFPSIEAAVLAEEASIPRREVVIDSRLLATIDDAAAADVSTGVIVVLRDQPAHAAGADARRRYAARFRELQSRQRRILDRIAPLRTADPGRERQLGDHVAEELLVLTEDERAEIRTLTDETRRLLRQFRAEVIEQSRDATRRDQAELLAWLGARPDVRVHRSHALLNAVTVVLPPRLLGELVERFAAISRVLPVLRGETALDVSVPTVGASSWTSSGYDGSSATKVAVIDTGIDSSHPAFSGGVVSDEAVHLSYAASLPASTSGFGDDASSTDDKYYHGTAVAGIVASNDSTYKGVAPGARLMNAKAGYKTVGGFGYYYDPDILDAGDWAAANGADVVNCSFGRQGTTDGSSALSLFFDAIVDDLAIPVTASAGNAGPSSGTVTTVGDGFNVITVGNVQTNRTTSLSDDGIYTKSSRGPLSDGRRKPDLSAPGELVYSCWYDWETQADFSIFGGTSAAAPHVAGALAILEDFNASWAPEATKALLLTNARNTGAYPAAPDDAWGYGGLDLAAVYANRACVTEGTRSSSDATYAFYRAPDLASGGRVTLCWNRQVASNANAAPTSYHALVDLDLHLYRESDGSSVGASASAVDSVEQVKLASALTAPVVKVKRTGALPSGVTEQAFAVAAEASGAITEASAPSLACTFPAEPTILGGDAEFGVTVRVQNAGELPAFAPAVTLTLPEGYAIRAGSNPQILSTLVGGSFGDATWTVVSASSGSSGSREIEVTASSTSFGETFASAPSASSHELDLDGPTGSILIEDGADFVPRTSVDLALQAEDGGGVVAMRFSNDAITWSAWEPYAATRAWDLAGGDDGIRTVWVQFRDGVGNASSLCSDSVVIDTTAPTGSFVLNGDRLYLLPMFPLVADTTSNDGPIGSGVAEFRVSHDAGGEWSAWLPVDETGAVEIPRPEGRGLRRVVGEFRDRMGNVSAPSQDTIHIVEDAPQPLGAIGRLRGSLSQGGDIDTFAVDLVAGDVLSIRGRLKVPRRRERFSFALDLHDPDGAVLFTGRYPEDARRSGVRRYAAERTGVHLLVLRRTGADAAMPGDYTLRIEVARPRMNRVFSGTTTTGVIDFPAPRGARISGSVRGDVTGPVVVAPPAGPSWELGVVRRRVIPAAILDGPTGSWQLRIPAAGEVRYRVRVEPPRRRSAAEDFDSAGP